MRFSGRADYIEWLIKGLEHQGALGWAFRDGNLEHLGLFSEIPPFGQGLITRATSKNNHTYIVAVVKKTIRDYGIYPIISVPWEFWIGDKFDDKLFIGDNPRGYKAAKEKK